MPVSALRRGLAPRIDDAVRQLPALIELPVLPGYSYGDADSVVSAAARRSRESMISARPSPDPPEGKRR